MAIAFTNNNPRSWLKHLAYCQTCLRFTNLSARNKGRTVWFSGDTVPVREGLYERLFSDGLFMHYWDGLHWRAKRGDPPHWRQQGSYPCWRGLTKDAKDHGTKPRNSR